MRASWVPLWVAASCLAGAAEDRVLSIRSADESVTSFGFEMEVGADSLLLVGRAKSGTSVSSLSKQELLRWAAAGEPAERALEAEILEGCETLSFLGLASRGDEFALGFGAMYERVGRLALVTTSIDDASGPVRARVLESRSTRALEVGCVIGVVSGQYCLGGWDILKRRPFVLYAPDLEEDEILVGDDTETLAVPAESDDSVDLRQHRRLAAIAGRDAVMFLGCPSIGTSGVVECFERKAKGWRYHRTIRKGPDANPPGFGGVLACDGERLFVGSGRGSLAPQTLTQRAKPVLGAVVVFSIDRLLDEAAPDVDPDRIQTIAAPSGLDARAFGASLAVRGDRLAIGDPCHGDRLHPTGAVHVYRWDGESYALERTIVGRADRSRLFGHRIRFLADDMLLIADPEVEGGGRVDIYRL